jgi:hypothetical protein
MMWRRLLILDLVLVAVFVAGALRVRQSWNEFDAGHRVETIQPESEPVRAVPGASMVAVTPEDWTDASVKNPFSFDRNDISILAPAQAPPTQPKPVLYGTMSIGSERIAMLAPGQSGNRASRPVKVGESLDNYWQVVEIQDKAVIVTAANGVRETININEQRARVYERTGNSGTAPPLNVVNTTAAPPQAATVNSQAPTPSATPPAPASSTGQPTGEMLLTPFGPVPRTRP